MKRKVKNILTAISLSLCISSVAIGFAVSLYDNIASAENSATVKNYGDLWRGSEGVSITSNVDVPSYAQSGYVNLGYSSSAGGYIAEKVEVSEREAWQLNGVQIATESESAIVQYANVIDISDFTENDHLIISFNNEHT